MTQSKAATVAAALINLGYFAQAQIQADGSTWQVLARSPAAATNITDVKSFADGQGVNGTVAEAVFV